MTTVTTPRSGGDAHLEAGFVDARVLTPRERVELLGLLFGTLGVLLVLALTLGGAGPIGQ